MTPTDIDALREPVLQVLSLGITAAQDWSADAVCLQRRAWQRPERGERAVPHSIYKVARIEVARIAYTAE